ncbi:HEAT repeat domain-containing protein [Persicobacter sp. CCB-QB2]|uniref:HEAT repeat domain-containing protein n=1 Tax=Persicobacter sp. CCB-QB2 TaxID=1561025 RepID=UPI0006A9E671|nr:hypothetical protein [Persicobacter sp. CCB-QB2]
MDYNFQKERILSSKPNDLTRIVDEFVSKNEAWTIELLIDLLESDRPEIRNAGAIGIYELRPQKALEPLLNAIFKQENHNYNGTLVWALGQLDCKNRLIDIFRILFYESYEAKISAYEILDSQIFEFSKTDLKEIKSMWINLQASPDRSPDFDKGDVRIMISDAVEGFLSYLGNNKKAGNK